MDALRKALHWLWPELILEGSSARSEWEQEQRSRFRRTARIFFAVAALAYIAHHYFFDIPNRLEPLESWFAFRFTMAAMCVVAAAYYYAEISNNRFYKLPALIILSACSCSQAFVTLAWPEAPWIYPYAFIIISVLVLQLSALKSLCWSLLTASLFVYPLLQAEVPLTAIVSATFFTSFLATFVRSALTYELQAFKVTLERDEERRRNEELQQEFSDRLKSFVPKVIYNRIQLLLSSKSSSPLEAMIEVLAPKRRNVACLFSDIRGFTRRSTDLDVFLEKSVLPEVRESSDVLEDYEGIPRKIGDLIFAYFDDPDEEKNLIRACLAGMSLSKLNQDFNATVASVEIARYILISTGDAVVGNVGGLDSGVEITALGPPVNFLSRLDDATKSPGLARQLTTGDLILHPDAANRLREVCPSIQITDLSLDECNVEIRDFPSTNCIALLRPSPENWQALRTEYLRSTPQSSTKIAA